jgi:hypothetical protein
MVYTYTSVQHTPQNAWKCSQSCFVTLNVPGADNANFNILVIGVPFSSVGNSTLLSQFNVQRTVDAYADANELTNTIYTLYPCLSGAFATYGGHIVSAWSSNAIDFLGNGLTVLTGIANTKGVLTLWALQGEGQCRPVYQ